MVRNLHLRAYPNPFSDVVVLELTGQEGTAALKLHDINGVEVMSKTVQTAAGTTRIELTEMNPLPTGVYFLRVHQGGHVAVQKLVHIH